MRLRGPRGSREIRSADLSLKHDSPLAAARKVDVDRFEGGDKRRRAGVPSPRVQSLGAVATWQAMPSSRLRV
jgi:hypothetical protein